MAIKFGRPIEMRDAPRRPTALASTPLDLAIRPRRNRKAEWARRLVCENVLTTNDLIWPMFVVDGNNTRTPVASIMAALGAMTIVVEAAGRSGSLITAELASELGREVGAVPGPVGARMSTGTNQLIADGARLRSAQCRQSGVPGGTRHQERISRYRVALRRRA